MGTHINHKDVGIKHRMVHGILWSAVERFSVQLTQLVIQVLIARILTPEDFGIIGMLAIFLAISQTFIDSGFSSALIRKTDRTEIDNTTVFYFNIVVGIIAYMVLYLSAPWIARFYETPILTPITRFVALGVFFNSLTIVQRAILTAKVDFKTQAKASLVAVVISGILGLYIAHAGFGVWALAVQVVVNYLLNTIMLWILTAWRPLWTFSWVSFRELFGFGSKLLLSGLLDTVFQNIYTIVIGKAFTATDLGYYTKASQFVQFPSSNVTGILKRVTYPVLCEYQDEDERLRQLYRKYLRLSAYVIFPLMIGLAAVARPLIVTLLTDQWNGVVLLLQILCVAMMWYPIHTINLNLLQVKGRSDLFLRLEIWKKIIGMIVLCATLPLGLVWLCLGQIATSLITLAINTYYAEQLIQLGFFKQMKDLVPALLYSFSMGGLVYWVIQFIEGNPFKVALGIVVGVIYYIVIGRLTHSAELRELQSLILKNK